ncbi:MATE family efflux transporter [Halorussus sp. MSC15.2]|uniref:MATE family efflux transporter n=1 Tax=Halorussus sp. MSC15.2 TaxID=2283638 RepID=UPI0013D85D10|nr:MATE family efflux transporter [Halorussus sp. MSC15.2]NEU58575.1 MATE family efflux transporter [Halorussus sp. MSC15.2]
MVDVSREEITDGSLVRSLLVLAAPLVVQNLVIVVQQVIDTFWVGRLGENAVAAVGVVFPVTALLFSVTIVLMTGTQVVVSQRVGAEDLSGGRRTMFHGVTAALAVGIVVGVVVFAGADEIVSALLSGETVASLAATYIAWLAVLFPFASMSDALEGGFIGWGDSRASMYGNVSAVVVNVVLDPFLILGWNPFPRLGIQGAALATGIGYTAGFLVMFGLYLRGRDGFTLTREAVGFDLDEYREIVDIGLPRGAQTAASQSVRVVIIAIISAVGGAAGLAAYNLGAQVATVAFVPAQGLMSAAQSVVGQNLGADRPDRARRTTWVGAAIAAVGLTALGTIQWAAPELIVTTFVPDMSAEAVALSVDYLNILVLGYWGIGAMYLFEAGFNGAGRTKVSLVAGLLKYWALRLPIAAVGAYWLDYGVHAVFWAVTISNVVAAVAAGAYYYYTTNNGMLQRAAEQAATSAD